MCVLVCSGTGGEVRGSLVYVGSLLVPCGCLASSSGGQACWSARPGVEPLASSWLIKKKKLSIYIYILYKLYMIYVIYF